MTDYARLDAWVDAHFDEEVRFLQELVRVPTDTPPGNNAPHAVRTAELLQGFGLQAESPPVPADEVRAYGMESITNLIVRREYGAGGRRVALNAHGDEMCIRDRPWPAKAASPCTSTGSTCLPSASARASAL